jgi:hypothetical protein
MGICITTIQIRSIVYVKLLWVLRVYSRDKLVKKPLLIIDIRVFNDLGNEFFLILRTTKIKVSIL